MQTGFSLPLVLNMLFNASTCELCMGDQNLQKYKNSKTPRWVLTEMSELKTEPLKKQAIKLQPLQFAYLYNTFLFFLPSFTHLHTDPANINRTFIVYQALWQATHRERNEDASLPSESTKGIREAVMKKILSTYIIQAEVSRAWGREEHARATPLVLTPCSGGLSCPRGRACLWIQPSL